MNIHANPQEDLLGLEGLATTRVDRASFQDEIFVYARSKGLKGACPNCSADAAAVHRHGREERRFKDVALHDRKTTIIVDRSRYRCTSCGKTWVERIPGLHERRMMTRRLEEHIARRCFDARFMDVAREHGIDEGTVRNVFVEHLAKLKESERPSTPQVLGIDEIHLSNRIPCVLTDVRRRKLFDILPSRTKDAITPYFDALPNKGNVNVVVADMWRPYHAIADQFFAGRLDVADKFHVVRMANNGLDAVRKKVAASELATNAYD